MIYETGMNWGTEPWPSGAGLITVEQVQEADGIKIIEIVKGFFKL